MGISTILSEPFLPLKSKGVDRRGPPKELAKDCEGAPAGAPLRNDNEHNAIKSSRCDGPAAESQGCEGRASQQVQAG